MKNLFFIIFLGVMLSSSLPVHASLSLDNQSSLAAGVATASGVSQSSVPTIVGALGRGIFALLGLFFFILVFYGGFKWMSARGNEEETLKATKTISAAFIGLAIILSAYAITSFLQNIL